MIITGVETKSHTHGIPLKGWDSVVNAVNLFASGTPRGSRDALNHNLNVMGNAGGGMGAVMFLMVTELGGHMGSFVNENLTKAKAAIERTGSWRGSWDYDGPGPFHKAGMTISLVDKEEEIYILTVYAAYVGDRPEVGLAEALQTERAYSWIQVACDLKPATDWQVLVNTNELARILKELFPDSEWDGPGIAKTLAMEPYHNHSVYLGDGLRLKVGISNVAEEGWGFESSLIVAKLKPKYREEGHETPQLSFSITSDDADEFMRAPIWQDAAKVRAVELSERIAGAFAKLLPTV